MLMFQLPLLDDSFLTIHRSSTVPYQMQPTSSIKEIIDPTNIVTAKHSFMNLVNTFNTRERI